MAMEKIPFDLNIVGVRKAEGGARATAYKSCLMKMILVVIIIDLYFGIKTQTK